MKAFVTGGAGFIASHLNDVLLTDGWDVTAVDYIDKPVNIAHLEDNEHFTYVKTNATDAKQLTELSKGHDFVFHLAANSDIQLGGRNPDVDFNNTFLTTRSVLEAMRVNDIKNLFFSSTSAVYGEKPGEILNETTGDLKPISYYGACKLASEALISAYTYMNSFNSLVFRFPNVVGPRLTHGVIFDFIKKLDADQSRLEILGDGRQSKQYVYALDLVDGIYAFSKKMESGMNIYNVSTESFTTVNQIADIICRKLGLTDVKYDYTGGKCGWRGDVPSFDYDVSKAKRHGWKYRYNSTESVERTVDSVLQR